MSTLTPQDSGHTRLRLDHVVLGGEQATGYGAGWEDFLARLEAALTGDDPQFASVETLLAPKWAAALAHGRPAQLPVVTRRRNSSR